MSRHWEVSFKIEKSLLIIRDRPQVNQNIRFSSVSVCTLSLFLSLPALSLSFSLSYSLCLNKFLNIFYCTLTSVISFPSFWCHIWNQHSRTSRIEKFHPKQRNLKIGIKNVLPGYFHVRILKSYYHIWNQHLRICQNVKFHTRI